MQINMATVGVRIKVIREKRNLTLEQLAQIVGRDKQTVWRWENAERGITFNSINIIAEKLDCHPLYLLGYEDDPALPYDKQLAGRGTLHRLRRGPVGSLLRDARKQGGMTTEELAARLDVPEAQLIKWEAQSEAPPPEVFDKIAHVLNVPKSHLLTPPEAPEKNDPRQDPIESYHQERKTAPPERFLVEIARRIANLDPDVMMPLLYKDLSDAQVRFIAATFRLAFDQDQGTRPQQGQP